MYGRMKSERYDKNSEVEVYNFIETSHRTRTEKRIN